jgi:hypothetical protein
MTLHLPHGLRDVTADAERIAQEQGWHQTLRNRFTLEPFGNIRPSRDITYTVKGFLPRAGLAVVWGPPKQGKTFWVLDIAMHVCLGWEYYGGRKVLGGPVAYCLFEGIEGFRARVEAFRQEKLPAGAEPPFYLMAERVDLIADHQELVRRFGEQLGDTHPRMVVLDTLNRSLNGSESSDEDMSAYVRAADAIRDAFNCLVCIIHHGPHDAQRPRGHGSLMGALDAQIQVSKTGDRCTAKVELAKDFADGAQQAFELRPVHVGYDVEGGDIESCVVEPTEAPGAGVADARTGLTPNQAALLTILEEAGSGGLTTEEWNEQARQVGIGARRQTLYQTRVKLKRKKLVHQDQSGRWHVTSR